MRTGPLVQQSIRFASDNSSGQDQVFFDQMNLAALLTSLLISVGYTILGICVVNMDRVIHMDLYTAQDVHII
ncbi:hypothetical protein P4S72_17715 [Vibrio sp. PP-XX7]